MSASNTTYINGPFKFDSDETRALCVAALKVASAGTVATATTVAGSYTLGIADNGKILIFPDTTSATLVINLQASTAYPDGTSVVLVRNGAGSLTVTGAVGVTIQSAAGTSARATNSIIALQKLSNDVWLLYGDLISSGSFSTPDW